MAKFLKLGHWWAVSVWQSPSCYHFKKFQQTSRVSIDSLKLEKSTCWHQYDVDLTLLIITAVGNFFVPIQKYLYAVRETYDRLTVNKKRTTRTLLGCISLLWDTQLSLKRGTTNERVRTLIETKMGNNWILNDYRQLWVVTFFFSFTLWNL